MSMKLVWEICLEIHGITSYKLWKRQRTLRIPSAGYKCSVKLDSFEAPNEKSEQVLKPRHSWYHYEFKSGNSSTNLIKDSSSRNLSQRWILCRK